MPRDWHEQFRTWAKAPSETEETKGSNAAEMIRKAVRASDVLSRATVDIYATGSYRNNTNVRLDSDIDIAVVLRDSFFYQLPKGLTREQAGLTNPATYSWESFRDDVGAALRAHFGRSAVEQGDKTYNISANTYRLNADVTPFLIHRRYTGEKDENGSWAYREGVELRSRSNGSQSVINWHEQHYDNGVSKNKATGRRYKRVVRILKKLKQDMAEKGGHGAQAAASGAPSFLIECLVYNAPNTKFNLDSGTYYDDVRQVIAWLWHQTKPGAKTDGLLEVSELKYLIQSSQPWTLEQAHAFVNQAWHHVGFKND